MVWGNGAFIEKIDAEWTWIVKVLILGFQHGNSS